ncbi:MAG: DciA family protein [Hyphomicrobiales bacterium]
MPKSLWQYFSGLTRTTFERYGFAYAEILSQWPVIVGDELAQISQPERVQWPRLPTPKGDRKAWRHKSGGKLVIRVADGRALQVQHETLQILERINSYYGYAAITEIRIVQDRLPCRQDNGRLTRPKLKEPEERALDHEISIVEDNQLREALRRLGRGVKARKS